MYRALLTIITAGILLLTLITTAMASWQIEIEVSTPDPGSDTGTAVNRLIIGTDPSGTDVYDNKLDTLALTNGPIQAYVYHPEYPSALKRLWRDYRSNTLPAEWELHIEAIQENIPVTIAWKVSGTDNIDFTLIDQDTNQEISSATENYSYTATSIPKRLLLKVAESTSTVSNPSTGNSGSSRGGGCGYIKDSRGRKDNKYGQGIMFMIILLSPLLMPSYKKLVRRIF